MAHSRSIQPVELPVGDDLTAAMIGIGMVFTGTPKKNPNIEDTLLAAAVAGMDHDDLRVLAILTTWFGIHSNYVIANRLTKIVEGSGSKRVRAYFSSLATWQARDHRFAALEKLRPSRRIDLLRSGTAFQIGRHGEDERFAKSALRVPAGTLRDRPSDVMTPATLSLHHRPYYWRIVIGPTYRADMWSVLEVDSEMTTADLARAAYGSFATAWRVRRDAAITALPTKKPSRST